MRKQKLGESDMEFSAVGLGAWAMGGGGWAYAWGEQDDQESVDAIAKALDLGVNWIDTAAVYGLGHSEEIVGKALKGRSNPPYVATKCGLVWNSKGKIRPHLSAASVREEAENSLRRLQRDVIDLYQIHWPTNPQANLDAWIEIQKMIQEGKIRYAGVSNFSDQQMEALKKIASPTSLQPPYSMVERGIEETILPYCLENGIGVVAYSPMQCGMLTGKMTRERIQSMPKDDFRQRDRHFQEPLLTKNLELAEGLKNIAEKAQLTVAQLSLAWVLKHPAVTSAIVGTRKPHQIEETARAAEQDLTETQINEVAALLS